MLERMLDGVIKGEYSLGWALLPLFRVSALRTTGCIYWGRELGKGVVPVTTEVHTNPTH